MSSYFPKSLSKSKWLNKLAERAMPTLNHIHEEHHIAPTSIIGVPLLLLFSWDLFQCIKRKRYDRTFKVAIFNFSLLLIIILVGQFGFQK
jgi:hypothetical protein